MILQEQVGEMPTPVPQSPLSSCEASCPLPRPLPLPPGLVGRPQSLFITFSIVFSFWNSSEPIPRTCANPSQQLQGFRLQPCASLCVERRHCRQGHPSCKAPQNWTSLPRTGSLQFSSFQYSHHTLIDQQQTCCLPVKLQCKLFWMHCYESYGKKVQQ